LNFPGHSKIHPISSKSDKPVMRPNVDGDDFLVVDEKFDGQPVAFL
jgi:hypothetical protein